MAALAAVSAGLGMVGAIGKMISRGRANKDLRNLMKTDPRYQANPLARERLSYATSIRDARMPGAAAVERNIMGAFGNQLSGAQRNATDASQMLAVGAAGQGQAQQGFMQLGVQEAQDQQRRYQNWDSAIQGQIGEEQMQFQDDIRRFGNKAQIQGAINQNRMATWGDISNMGFGMADFAQAGGFEGMFNKKGAPGGFTSPTIDQAGLQRALLTARNRNANIGLGG